MRKSVLTIILLLALCCGCNRGNVVIHERIDYGYDWYFIVANETSNKVLIITQDYPYGPYPHLFALAPLKEEEITGFSRNGGESTAAIPDIFEDNFRIGVGGMIGVGDEVGGYPFTMTIDGEKIPNDIWLRKYWSFTSTFYTATYTLNVTDRLLAELSALR